MTQSANGVFVNELLESSARETQLFKAQSKVDMLTRIARPEGSISPGGNKRNLAGLTTQFSRATVLACLGLLFGSPGAGSLLTLPAFGAQTTAAGESLIVAPGSIMSLGDPAQASTFNYGSLTIENGGTLQLQGDATINVQGDMLINGTITMTPEGKAQNGPNGMDGTPGLDNQLTGGNVGLSGTFPGTAPGWSAGGVPRLTLRAEGSVVINGTIRLEPAFHGGDGGRGGHGGRGGTGRATAPGSAGGGGSQGGQGGAGGYAVTLGATLRIVGERIDLTPTSRIYLDNKGVGGTGGVGGNGGHGGAGGDGADGTATDGGRGGSGGPPGSGGTGGDGGAGGSLQLVADFVTLDGEISVRGGNGGDGGPIGTPGNGADGGNAGPESSTTKRGGDGGHAGGGLSTLGFTGGKGGRGGPGGQVRVQATAWSIGGTIIRDGGEGGLGGPGVPAGRATGGLGGSPSGVDGMDSMRFPEGEDGQKGGLGRVLLVLTWFPGIEWEVSEPVQCIEPFTDELDASTTISGVKMCGGNCLSSFVNITPGQPYELSFNYRFLTTVGALEFRLGGQLIHRVEAPASLSDRFESARVLITDPAILNGFQRLEVCLVPAGPAMVQLANLSFRVAESNPPPPQITTRIVGGTSTIEFTWPSVSGHNYQLQTRASLSAGTWSNLGAALPGTGGVLTATAPITSGQSAAFYRIVIGTQ